jgi:ketosteroid isomerase-like protein
MHSNETLIRNFYAALGRGDAASMAAAYHDDARFSDPAFPNLDTTGVRGMWTMLTASAQNFSVECDQVQADGQRGSCRWQAWYTFSQTGRPVHNVIRAEFEFRDGKIVRHTDHFDFWRWSRQALGLPGWLLGWTPFLQQKVQATAGERLRRFLAR